MLLNAGGREIRVRGRLVRSARLEGDGFEFLEDPAATIEDLRRTPARVDLLSFIPRLPGTEAHYAFPMEWESFAAIPITTFEHWWTQQIGFKARNKAKQAEKKGVILRELPFSEELVKGIWAVYNETPVRQGRKFPHFGKDLETVHREEATFLARSVFVGAFQGEELIGFIKMVVDETGTQASFMNIVSMIKHRDKAPTNALVAQAVRICAERGIRYLVYSRFTFGNRQNSTILDFKVRNAFEEMRVPRYYVPLTALGRVALRLGLHHGLKHRIPESVIDKLRNYRATWYARKFELPNEAQ